MFTKDDDVDLKDVLAVSLAQETAEASTSLIRGVQSNPPEEQINKIRQQSQSRSHADSTGGSQPHGQNASKRNFNASKSCPNCGSHSHIKSRDCPHKDAECYNCNKKGHFAKMCRSSIHSNQVVEVGSIQINFSSQQQLNKGRFMIAVSIMGVPHVMELDTGCERSLVSKEFWKNGKGAPLLKKSHTYLKTYTQEDFKPIGELLSIRY